MKAVNINAMVKVKLTEEGLKILMEQHKELLQSLKEKPLVAKGIEEFEFPKTDESGFSEFTLHELMHIFGPYMFNGNTEMPFEETIAISEEYLVDYTDKKERVLNK